MKKFLILISVLSIIVGEQGNAQEEKAKPEIPAWVENITPNGDIRYRYELIDEEDKDTRERHRIRVRLGLKAKINEDADAVFRIATSQDNDPISTNQTFDDGFSKKNVFWDLAYLDFHPQELDQTSILAGKMEVPFYKVADLVWDHDLTPEGLGVKKTFSLADGVLDLGINGGGYIPEERSSEDDTHLYGAQLLAKIKPEKDVYVLGTAGYYHFDNMSGYPTLFNSERGYGNTTISAVGEDGAPTGGLLYAEDYHLWDFQAEVGFNPIIPIAFYTDWVFNTEVDSQDTGYMFGTRIGKAKDPGDFDFEYNYRKLERDAVVGLFTDSDVFGGGTDAKGHRFTLGVQLLKAVRANFSYFSTKLAISSPSEIDSDRYQIELLAKF